MPFNKTNTYINHILTIQTLLKTSIPDKFSFFLSSAQDSCCKDIIAVMFDETFHNASVFFSYPSPHSPNTLCMCACMCVCVRTWSVHTRAHTYGWVHVHTNVHAFMSVQTIFVSESTEQQLPCNNAALQHMHFEYIANLLVFVLFCFSMATRSVNGSS